MGQDEVQFYRLANNTTALSYLALSTSALTGAIDQIYFVQNKARMNHLAQAVISCDCDTTTVEGR